MSRIASGVTGATPIFNKIMSALLNEKPNHDWEIPEGLVQVPICTYTGTLTCSGCPTKTEWFLEENVPKKTCNPSWFNKNENQQQVQNNSQVNPIITPTPETNVLREIIDKRINKKRR